MFPAPNLDLTFPSGTARKIGSSRKGRHRSLCAHLSAEKQLTLDQHVRSRSRRLF